MKFFLKDCFLVFLQIKIGKIINGIIIRIKWLCRYMLFRFFDKFWLKISVMYFVEWERFFYETIIDNNNNNHVAYVQIICKSKA